jgi:NAD-dependent SIR2 family protein deacetylase
MYERITKPDMVSRLREELDHAEGVIIGAGAGLSSAAGFLYGGERFQKYFYDFYQKYHYTDMYSGGFYPFPQLEEFWGNWSRQIYVNRYLKAPRDTYEVLFQLVKEKDYFVLTTNVDHQFQKAGFDKERLFYTQGDFGLLQCSVPCHPATYDNRELVLKMLSSQGITLDEQGDFDVRKQPWVSTCIDEKLIPRCPRCGEPMSMNLRCDNTFVQDTGWEQGMSRYEEFLNRQKEKRILFLELGVGGNTPGIIKYSFWRFAAQWPNAFYACINLGEAYAPQELRGNSLCIDGDLDMVLRRV